MVANPEIDEDDGLTLSYEVEDDSNIEEGETAFEITSAMSGNMGLYTCTAVNKVAITELIYNLIVGGV